MLAPGGDDDRLAPVLAIRADDPLDLALYVQALDRVVLEFDAEAERLLLVELREVRASDGLREAGVVLDLPRVQDLTANRLLLDNQRLEHRADCVDRGGERSSAPAHDDDVVLCIVTHDALFLLRCSYTRGTPYTR